MRQKVGIFRLQLFKPSETFIAAQAESLSRYEPIYIGRQVYGHAPPDSEGRVYATAKSTRIVSAAQVARMAITADPSAFTTALAREQPALIHAHFATDGIFAAHLARSLSVPLICTIHGYDVTRTTSSLLSSFRPFLVSAALRSAWFKRQSFPMICISEYIRAQAIAAGYSPERLTVHYIGIDCKRLAFRRSAGDGNLIVHVARLVEKKGTTFLLRAVAEVRKVHPAVQLLIIGDGPLRAQLQNEAKSLGLQACARFVGEQPNCEVLRVVRAAAMLAIPSVVAGDGDAEGLGIVNLEAGAQGVPVVGFASGGIPEAVKHGETGFLSPERDVAGLARSICRLLENSDLRARLGGAARDYVTRHFDIERQTTRLECMYDAALRAASL